MKNRRASPATAKLSRAHCIDNTRSITLTEAIQAAGMSPSDRPLLPGITRFPGVGKGPSNKSGWCWLSDDRQGAAFGDYSTGLKETWQAARLEQQPAIDWLRINEARAKAEREQEQKKKQHGIVAVQRFKAGAVPSEGYGYLKRKQIERFTKLFRLHFDGRLMALLETVEGPCNVQYIAANGEKRFHYGARVTGAFCVVQRIEDPTHLIICEGIATGCTLAMIDSRATVIAAMNAANLLTVARDIRRTFRRDRIIIAGDNDRFTFGNPGKTKAIEAARAIDAEYSIPEFRPGISGTDFNDLMCAGYLS